MQYRLEAFGQTAKAIRKSHRLSQKNVKEIVGINEDTLRRLEQGSTLPTIETLDLLSLAYRCDMNHIFSGFKLTFDDYFERRLDQIKPTIRHYDFEAQKGEAERFTEEFKNMGKINHDILEEKFHQFEVYLIGLSKFDEAHDDLSRQVLTDLVDVVKYDTHRLRRLGDAILLDKLEIRIFLLISLIYRRADELENSFIYIESAIAALNNRYKHDKDYLSFYFLLNSSLLANYHRTDELDKMDDLYKAMLKVFDEKVGVTFLTQMMVRAGVNKYKLNAPYSKDFLNAGLVMLIDAGYEVLGKKNHDRLMDRYPEIFKT